MTLHFKVDMY